VGGLEALPVDAEEVLELVSERPVEHGAAVAISSANREDGIRSAQLARRETKGWSRPS
jgi:hypothetical protein